MMKLINTLNNTATSFLMNLPSPKNISILWNMGFLLGIILFTQIITGLLLTFFYTADTLTAFSSIEYSMRLMNNGFLLRWLHMNSASMFFMFIYIHMFRGIFFSSYKYKDTWNSGLFILILLMMTAFMGYVLPWGQMSFWAATVITKFFSVIPIWGPSMVSWLWTGFNVNNFTLKFFFSLHFLLPLVLLMFVILHIILLHLFGSSSPLSFSINTNKIKFHPYFLNKDFLNFIIMFLLIIIVNIWFSSEPENFYMANPVSSPAHIKPEWYFLFAYAILRSIPQKLMGVILMALSLIILFLFSVFFMTFSLSTLFTLNSILFFSFFSNFVILSWIGGNPVTDMFVIMGQISSFLYFGFICMMISINWGYKTIST